MRQKSLEVSSSHIQRVTLSVEQDEAPDPVDIRFFGAVGIVFEPEQLAYVVE